MVNGYLSMMNVRMYQNRHVKIYDEPSTRVHLHVEIQAPLSVLWNVYLYVVYRDFYIHMIIENYDKENT